MASVPYSLGEQKERKRLIKIIEGRINTCVTRYSIESDFIFGDASSSVIKELKQLIEEIQK